MAGKADTKHVTDTRRHNRYLTQREEPVAREAVCLDLSLN